MVICTQSSTIIMKNQQNHSINKKRFSFFLYCSPAIAFQSVYKIRKQNSNKYTQILILKRVCM